MSPKCGIGGCRTEGRLSFNRNAAANRPRRNSTAHIIHGVAVSGLLNCSGFYSTASTGNRPFLTEKGGKIVGDGCVWVSRNRADPSALWMLLAPPYVGFTRNAYLMRPLSFALRSAIDPDCKRRRDDCQNFAQEK